VNEWVMEFKSEWVWEIVVGGWAGYPGVWKMIQMRSSFDIKRRINRRREECK